MDSNLRTRTVVPEYRPKGLYKANVDEYNGDTNLHFIDASTTVIWYAICILLSLALLASSLALCLLAFGPIAALLLVTGLSLVVVAHHFYLLRKRGAAQTGLEVSIKSKKKDSAQDISHFTAVSYLYILGSGGHTTEMMALIKLSFKANKNQHRRYIITSGDKHSVNQEKLLESLIETKCLNGTAGTHDTLVVTRARAVYQSYLTSVLTSLRCALDILVALTKIPAQRSHEQNAEGFRFPHVIITNGPGTGFIVCLVAHILKVLCLVPRDRLKIVFVETWARTHKLGLTGKLFHLTGIADLFVVQSETLSKIVGKPSIGNVNTRYAELGRFPALVHTE